MFLQLLLRSPWRTSPSPGLKRGRHEQGLSLVCSTCGTIKSHRRRKGSNRFRCSGPEEEPALSTGGSLKCWAGLTHCISPVSYTHLRAHETPEHLVCRLLLEKKKK